MNKLMYHIYYTISIYLPQLLGKVVAAITCALSIPTGYKPVTCYKLLCPPGECSPQECYASLYIKNPCAAVAV